MPKTDVLLPLCLGILHFVYLAGVPPAVADDLPGVSAVAPPNIVLILSDDQDWHDYGFMGSEVVETPHLDRLARRSLVFERGYVVTALCRPSLASIVTGLYPHQHGVVGNDVSPATKLERHKENQPIVDAFHRHPSWIRSLVAQGYMAFQSGKWWEGSWQEGGFTGGMTHGDPTRGGRHGDEGLSIGRQGMAPVTEFIDSAVAAKKPFCLWYAPFLPHAPHNPPAKLLEKYTIAGRPENVARYLATCEWFDQTCGELLQHLEKRQLTDNTIVVFLADNGWTARDDSAELPAGWSLQYAPRSKGSPYEGGLRTPLMISWPEKISSSRSAELASSLDLMPTLLNACNAEPIAGLPGIDLLDPDARRQREIIFGSIYSTHNINPGNPASTLQYHWCIQGNWKLLLRFQGSDTTRYKALHDWDVATVRLYDLKADPKEQKDLATQNPEIVEALREKIAKEFPF